MDGRMSVLTIPSPFAAHGLLYITQGIFRIDAVPWVIKQGAEVTLPDVLETKGAFVQRHQISNWGLTTQPPSFMEIITTHFDQGMMTCHHALSGEVSRSHTVSLIPALPHHPGLQWKNLLPSRTARPSCCKQARVQNIGDQPLEELCLATPRSPKANFIRTASALYCITNPKLTQMTR